MFCSWKTGPCAPCSCAYRLRSSIPELLNHLCHLGPGTLVMRRRGLSLARATCFGLHISQRSSGWNLLRDAVSGLETDLTAGYHAYLLTDISDSRPLFAMGSPGRPIDFSFRLDGHKWASPAIQKMIECFDGVPLDCLESRRLGAGAWLDEWEQARHPLDAAISRRLMKANTDILSCEDLEIHIQTTCQRSTAVFRPTFIDMEGTVLRIADRLRHHVVYADVAEDGFSLEPTDSCRLILSHHA